MGQKDISKEILKYKYKKKKYKYEIWKVVGHS